MSHRSFENAGHIPILYSRVSHYVSKIQLFNVVIIRQAHLNMKVPKTNEFPQMKKITNSI